MREATGSPTRHHPSLVPQARRPQIRWLEGSCAAGACDDAVVSICLRFRIIVPPRVLPLLQISGIVELMKGRPWVRETALSLTFYGLVRMSTSDTIREKRDTQTPLEPLFVALEHIEARGSLLLFAPNHAQRVRLMKAMTEIELVAWNATVKKYELTPFGRQRLAEYRGTASTATEE
jgi:hypothetical protein